MNVFTQGIIWKTANLIGSSRAIISNRINNVNLHLTAGLKKDTREKLKELPEKPKKPLNPYIRFVKENRELVVAKNPNLKATEVMKKVAEQWKNFDGAKREKYKNEYKKESEEYVEKIAKYNVSLTDDQLHLIHKANEEKKKDKERRALKKMQRETGKPKMPVPPFFRYLIEQHKITNKTVVELATELKDTWANMSSSAKEKYEQEYLKEKEKYDAELQKWETQMIKKGNVDLVREKTLKNQVSSKAFQEIKQKRTT